MRFWVAAFLVSMTILASIGAYIAGLVGAAFVLLAVGQLSTLLWLKYTRD